MTGGPVSAQTLRAALDSATSDAAVARLASALEAIGWRGDDLASAEEVAEELLPALAACARGQGDLGTLYRQAAEVLRGYGPQLDGSLPPVSSYEPAAIEVVRLFVNSE